MNRAQKKELFINALISTGKEKITKSEITEICQTIDIAHPYWFTNDEKNKLSRGLYKVPNVNNPVPAIDMVAKVLPMTKPVEKSEHRIVNVQTDLDSTNLIPSTYKNYVPFGNFTDVLSIVNSHKFFPVFITGHSGNGKTMSVEQACAKAKRKFV